MKTCRILMPIGALGGGISQEDFDIGIRMNPDVIAIDAGSTDSGPASLATGTSKYSRMMQKRDLKIAAIGAMQKNIPLLIGSCGTCGADATVNLFGELMQEIFEEEGLHGKVAKILTQVQPETLQRKWDEGKIHALPGAPNITRETFAECDNIVAVMGAEPFQEALKNGAQIVLCGRATDTAIMAAVPLMMGCDPAAAWHGAKTVECGAQCTDDETAVGVFLVVDEEGFEVIPLREGTHCTPYTVSAHLLYENIDPYRLVEPSGTIVTDESVYTPVTDAIVRVTGTKFEHTKQYTNKLEAASVVGYQTIALVGMADKDVLADPQKWIDNVTAYVTKIIRKMGVSDEEYSVNFKAYGYNAVLAGPVPEGTPTPREIGMLMTVTAKTQQLATQVAKSFNSYLLHFPARFDVMLPSFAFPFSPVDIPRGATYEFKLFHVVESEPLEYARFEYMDL